MVISSASLSPSRLGGLTCREIACHLPPLPSAMPPRHFLLDRRTVVIKSPAKSLEPGTTKNDEGRVFPFGVLPELANVLRAQWEKSVTLELATGQTVPTVFFWNDRGTIKPIHRKALYHRWKEACRLAGVPQRIPHDFHRTAVRNLERAGGPRSVAMKLTGH